MQNLNNLYDMMLNFNIIINFMSSYLILFIILNYYIHPLNLIIMLIFYTLIMSLLIALWSNTSLFAMLMFIMMIGGMMIMFLYFSSLINNDKYELINFWWYMYTGMLLMFTTYSYMYVILPKKLNTIMLFIFNEISSMKINFNYSMLNLIYMNPFFLLTILTIMYLLLSLMYSIKISSIKSSPLRKIK